MTLESSVDALISSLKGEEIDVSLWDYNILDNSIAKAIVVRPASMVSEISAYGPEYTKVWSVLIEIHVSIGSLGLETTTRELIQTIDKIVELLERRPHLGTGDIESIQSTRISGMTVPDNVTSESGVVNWRRTILTLQIIEYDSVTEIE